MPRAANGIYQRPANTTAVAGTLIKAEDFNSAMDDIAAEITASIPRDGRAGADKLILAAGTLLNPSLQFVDNTTGLYWDAAGTRLVIKIGGVEVGSIDAAGFSGGMR